MPFNVSPCKTVTGVDIHPATVGGSLFPDPMALRKANFFITNYGGSYSLRVVRYHVFVMVKILIQVHEHTEIRADRVYTQYYFAPNLGDKINLRELSLDSVALTAWRSWRFSLRSLVIDLISVPYLSRGDAVFRAQRLPLHRSSQSSLLREP